jgi:hypothetical protein
MTVLLIVNRACTVHAPRDPAETRAGDVRRRREHAAQLVVWVSRLRRNGHAGSGLLDQLRQARRADRARMVRFCLATCDLHAR